MRGSIRNQYSANPQLAFANASTVLSAMGSGHASTGTLLSISSMTGIYSPTRQTSATLYAHVMNFRWTKDTTPSYVSVQQTSTVTKPATTVFAKLRTLQVYAERPSVYVTYTLHDEDGSFYTSTPHQAVVTVDGVSGSGTCSTQHLASIARRHADSCLLTLASSDFGSSDSVRSVTITVTPTSGATPISVHTGDLTLKASPNWYVDRICQRHHTTTLLLTLLLPLP